MRERSQTSTQPTRQARVPSQPGPSARRLTSRSLLRRLARLDIVVLASEGPHVTVQSPTGVTAVVRPGWWSHDQIRELLFALELYPRDFDDTR